MAVEFLRRVKKCYGARHLVTTTFVQTNRKSGKNPKFFSSGRITYLINTRLLTRGFYIKNFFEEVIIFFRAPIWRPMRYLVLFSRECSQNSLGHVGVTCFSSN